MTTRPSASLWLGAVAALFLLPQTAAAGVVLPDEAASPGADGVRWLYLLMLAVGVVALVAVIVAILGAARAAASGDGDRTAGSAKGAISAGTGLFLILAAIGAVSFAGASTPDASKPGIDTGFEPKPLIDPTLKVGHDLDPPKGSMSVNVNGQQYLWRYIYPGSKNIYSYHDLVIPAGVTVMLDLTSSDVVHSWWVPQLGGAFEAVPGYINRAWIRADRPGIYHGASTTPSGPNYPGMTTTVKVVSIAEFEAWASAKNDELREAADGLASGTAGPQGDVAPDTGDGAASGTAADDYEEEGSK